MTRDSLTLWRTAYWTSCDHDNPKQCDQNVPAVNGIHNAFVANNLSTNQTAKFADTTKVGTWAVKDYPVSAVPEPETYALMLAGLGIIGVAVRKRKLKQA